MKLNQSITIFCLLISAAVYSQPTFDTLFTKVDTEASFPGGDQAWRRFLEKNVKGEIPSDKGAPVGLYTVLAQFVVDVDGKVSDIKMLTNEGFGMEQELTRVLKLSGAWTPAKIGDKPVKAYRKQPLTFVIAADDYDIRTKVDYTLFIGVENELTVEVEKTKPEDLQLTISKGTLTSRADGKYIARVNETGRVLIKIFNTKKNKPVGDVSLTVKPLTVQ